MPLPPGLSERQFRRALDAFADVVGRQCLFDEDADVNL